MEIKYAARVDIGPKETNDDRILVDGKILDQCSENGTVNTPATVVVCDGCGGYLGGNIAAQTVLEHLQVLDASSLYDVEALENALYDCQKAVMALKDKSPELSKMCTTIAGCIFADDGMIIFHSGDSRVYRCDRWGLARMTKDHSVVQDMIDEGEITPEEARIHPNRSIITRCIGVKALPPEIHRSGETINPGEKFVFCSDGLWEALDEDEIVRILNSDLSLGQMAEELVDNAIRKGSGDNISVCICSLP